MGLLLGGGGREAEWEMVATLSVMVAEEGAGEGCARKVLEGEGEGEGLCEEKRRWVDRCREVSDTGVLKAR